MNSRYFIAAITLAALLLALAKPVYAIPAFARKYHTTCARCHSVVPRLNNYGWNFKLRGFHVPGDEDVGMMPTPEDKHLHLLDQVPLAIRLQGNVAGSTAHGAQSMSTLDSEIDLLTAGTLAPRIGYWAEIDVPKNPDGSHSVEIGNVRGIFRDLVRSHPTALTLEVGKFNMDEFGISTGRILTQNPYAIYAIGDMLGNFPESDEVQGFNFYGAVGTGIGQGVGPVAQKEGKAGEVTEAEKKELEQELNQAQAPKAPESPELIAVRAVLDALVRKGTLTQEDADKTLTDLAAKLPAPAAPPAPPPPAEEAAKPGPISLAKTDYDVRKGLFYQAGLVTRSADNGSQPQGYARLIYNDRHDWWVGPIGYFGNNRLTTVAGPTFINHFSRAGIEAELTTGARRNVAGVARKAVDIQLAGQLGSDNNIDGAHTLARHSGGFAELAYLFDDQNLGVIRYDQVHSRELASLDISTVTINYTRYLQRNLKIGLEYVPDLLGNSATHTRADQYFAFYDFTF